MSSRILDGRRVVDRAGAAAAAEVSLWLIDQLYRDRALNGFPDRVPGTTEWWEDDILAWKARYAQAKASP